MTEEQLQLLRAARPSGQDGQDPAVAAAMAAAQEDAGLTARLESERQTDLGMQRALRGVEPPTGLQASILAAMRGARSTSHAEPPPEPPPELRQSVLSAVRPPTGTNAPPGPSRRRFLGWGLATAASLTAAGLWWRQRLTFSTLKEEVAGIAGGPLSLAFMSMDKLAIAAWMQEHSAPHAGSLPASLDALPRKGCQLYTLRGQSVSLECFVLPGMKFMHLFCTPSAGLVDPPAEGAAPEVSASAHGSVASWARGGQTVVIISRENPAAVQAMLA